MEALTDSLLALFASSAATYEKFEARSGFSAAAARQINNVGAKLYYGAKELRREHRTGVTAKVGRPSRASMIVDLAELLRA